LDHVKERPHSLLLEAGGLLTANPQAPTERPGEAEARADVLMQTMAHMGYAAMNVGLNDLAMGLEPLRKVAKAHKIPLLSANLYDKVGKPAFQRTLIVDKGVLKIGVFGLITRTPPELGKFVIDQGLEIRDPIAEAKSAVQELQARGVDLIVVASQLSRQEAEAVMEHVPGITLVLGSSGMELSMQLTAMGPGFFVDPFTKGKYIGEVVVHVRAKKDRFYAARMRDSLMAERADLAQQVQGLQSQRENANTPGDPLQLTEDTRKAMERQLATARARLQGVTMQLDGQVAVPADASTLDMTMTALGTELKDDPWVAAKVEKLQEKFPKLGGH
jgi:2',3'-cyclic-nucleotide 2'-phosphodiesterase (5'-nucleotidase family)